MRASNRLGSVSESRGKSVHPNALVAALRLSGEALVDGVKIDDESVREVMIVESVPPNQFGAVAHLAFRFAAWGALLRGDLDEVPSVLPKTPRRSTKGDGR